MNKENRNKKIARATLEVVLKKGYPLESWFAPITKDEKIELLKEYGVKEWKLKT